MQSLLKKKEFQKGSILLLIAGSIFWIGFVLGTGDVETAIESNLRGFTLILWSILLEALPFVMLGTIISSLIQVFVTEDMILQVMPKSNFFRLIVSALIGLIFPVCECAIIPITRGLLKKGMPTGPAIAFMLATPIINPIVLLSTYNAFPTMAAMMPMRAVCGFIGAIAIGALAGKYADGKSVLKDGAAPVCSCGCGPAETQEQPAEPFVCTCTEQHGDTEHEHTHVHGNSRKNKLAVIRSILEHTNRELQSVGMYLIFGAMIAAAMQMAVPTEVLTGIGSGRILSIVVMMALAFILSLCSEADAFVANTFLLQFSGASVLAFLIVGPMVDIKNTMMMLGSFRKGFTVRLIATILLVCFVLALLVSFFPGGMYA